MKLLKNFILLVLSFSLLSFTSVLFEEAEVKYEIISQGKTSALNFNEQTYFTIKDIFEYDEFWIHLTGNTTNKPYVDMNKSSLIVFGGGGKIDKITFSDGFVNIYTSRKKTSSNQSQDQRGFPELTYATAYRLIKIPYNNSPVKWFEQLIETEEQEK